MMKKVICLVLLLALTSVSQAVFTPDLVILVNGDRQQDGADVKPSDVITVQFKDIATSFIGSLANGFNQQVNMGELIGEVFLVPGGSLNVKNEVVVQGDGFQVNLQGTYITVPMPSDDIVFSYSFHVPNLPASTIITINTTGLYGSVSRDALDATLHVVPEPMTVMLLGLGGLFLRRRKA
jgi:hypothetical protein